MAWHFASFVPTEEQRKIQQSDAERIIIEANAGVGKTTVLCLRVLQLLKQRADPSRILMLTFTEPGSEAILRTLRKLGVSASLKL